MNRKTLIATVAVLAVAFATSVLFGYPPTLSPESIALLPALGAGMINLKAGEKLALVGTIDPQTVVNSEVFSDVVDMSKFHQTLGIAMYGNMAAETITFRAVICDSSGNNAAALKAPTALTANATTNDNTQQIISVRAEEVAAAAGGNVSLHYCKFGLVTGNSTGGPAAVTVLGVDARSGLASALDLATVQEIKL